MKHEAESKVARRRTRERESKNHKEEGNNRAQKTKPVGEERRQC